MSVFSTKSKSTSSNSSSFNSRKGEDFFGIQAKLNIGKSNDKYEVEADRMADTVVSNKKNIAPEPFFTSSPTVQNKVAVEGISPVRQPKLKVVHNKHVATPETFFHASPVIQSKRTNEIQRKNNQEKETQKETPAKKVIPLIQLKLEKEETVQNKIESPNPNEKTSTSKSLVQPKKEEDIQKKNAVEKVDIIPNKTDSVKTESPKNKDKGFVAKPLIQKKEEDIQAKEEEEIQTKEDEKELQMNASADANPSDSSNLENTLNTSKGGGSPLSGKVKNEMESGFGANFGNIRIHNNATAVQMNKQLGAQAFATGNNIYFNEGKYNPNSQDGKHLLAHELTHTVQQGASIRKKPVQITPAPEMIQGSFLDLVPNWIIDKARYIPGYTLFTVIIAYDPLRDTKVERTPINLIEGLMGLIPFGTAIFDKLQEYKILQQVFDWVNGKLSELGLTTNGILKMVEEIWKKVTFPYSDIIDLITKDFEKLIAKIKSFVTATVDQVITWVKEALIGIAEPLLAENKAWSLIKYDPLRDKAVNATTVEILEDFLILIGKETELEQMREKGTLKKTADWLDTQVGTFTYLLGELRRLITAAWDAIKPSNLVNIASNLSALAAQAGGFLKKVWDFASGVARKVLELVKDSLLAWLSSQAATVRGYSLIKVIIGKDPFTNQKVERTIPNLIRGFMSLMEGGEEQYTQMVETGAIARIVGQIEAAVATLNMTPAAIIQLFTDIWNSFTINDLIHPLDAFTRIIAKFGEPIGRLIVFVAEIIRIVIVAILEIMNFPFDLIGNIINKAMQAIEDIKKDPIGFLKNILRAIKQGFVQFFDNIVTHLIGGLTGWLMSELKDANVPVLTDFSLKGVISWVLQVLDISMEKIWEKLAAHPRIGPARVAKIRGMINTLEGIWTFIKDVQERGIAAIWDKIQEQLSNLWNTVLDAVKNFVMERIVKKMTTKLLSMLDPTGIMAVINGAIALYSAIQSFIKYLREMLEIVNSFVSGVADIAKGNVATAANYLERTMGDAMPIVIGFLANQAGLSGIGKSVGEMIISVRKMVDEALTWLVNKAVDTGMNMLNKVMGKGGDEDGDIKSIARRRLVSSLGENASIEEARRIAAELFTELRPKGLHSLEVSPIPNTEGEFYIDATASPLEHLLKLLPEIKDSEPAVTLAVRLTLDPQQSFKVATENRELIPGFVKPYIPKGQPGIDPGTVEPRKFPAKHQQTGSFNFANISTGGRVSRGSGGAILIPSTPTNIVELLSWSNGGIQTKVCHNDAHAEHQFMNWFNSQPPSLIAGIKKVDLKLQSLSPCSFCVHDLIKIITNPNIKPDAVFNITWTKVFKTRGVCHELNTTSESLNNLKASGWNISGKMPTKEVATSENLTIKQLKTP